jgi:hypothetical protein
LVSADFRHRVDDTDRNVDSGRLHIRRGGPFDRLALRATNMKR